MRLIILYSKISIIIFHKRSFLGHIRLLKNVEYFNWTSALKKLNRVISYFTGRLKVKSVCLVYLYNNDLSNLQTNAHSPDMKKKLYSII